MGWSSFVTTNTPSNVVKYTASTFTAVDLSLSSVFEIDVDGDFTLDYINSPAGDNEAQYRVRLKVSATTPPVISYASGKFKAPRNVSTLITPDVGGIDTHYWDWDSTDSIIEFNINRDIISV